MPTTNDNYKDDQGQVHTQTDWHTIVFWRNIADIAEKHIKKGSYYHRRQAKIRSYDNKYRKKRYFTEVIAE
jgi:single-strand DNA-binding protein